MGATTKLLFVPIAILVLMSLVNFDSQMSFYSAQGMEKKKQTTTRDLEISLKDHSNSTGSPNQQLSSDTVQKEEWEIDQVKKKKQHADGKVNKTKIDQSKKDIDEDKSTRQKDKLEAKNNASIKKKEKVHDDSLPAIHNTKGQSYHSGSENIDIDSNKYVAACLMVMDENHYLIEWLAYHYHVLPLRRLIIHPDPESKTSPVPILERWNDRINYTVYNISDIYPSGKYNTDHQRQQMDFMVKCMSQLKAEGHHWTVLTDVDEFTHVNLRASDREDPMYNFGFNEKQWIHPSQKESGSVLALLDYGSKNENPQYGLGARCIGIARKNFGAAEYETSNYTMTLANHGFNSSHVATHPWRHHAEEHPFGKTIIDVSRVSAKDMTTAFTVHRPLRSVCYKGIAFGNDMKHPLVANHYSGTLEQMLFRSGDHWTTNRTARFYDEVGKPQGTIAPTEVREWLDGFIESVGIPQARQLLKHVGKPNDAASLQTNTSKMELLDTTKTTTQPEHSKNSHNQNALSAPTPSKGDNMQRKWEESG